MVFIFFIKTYYWFFILFLSGRAAPDLLHLRVLLYVWYLSRPDYVLVSLLDLKVMKIQTINLKRMCVEQEVPSSQQKREL